MASVRVAGVRKAFGQVVALDGVDLTVPAGSLTTVLGPSGCGKTTLLRCIAGFEPVDAGTIEVDGTVLAHAGGGLPPERRRAAVVPQEGALFPHLSVAGNVAYGLDRAARRAGRAAEVLGLVGLGGLGERMPHELSGGQQQRVAVARALAPRPPLVLLDEPFSALDASLRVELREDVQAALKADGATAILVTHDQGEALAIADQVAVMRAGRIVQSGSPIDVYTAPVDPWVAAFVGEAVLLPAALRDGHVTTSLGVLPVAGPPGQAPTTVRIGAVTALIRPEQVDLVPAGAAGAAVGAAMVAGQMVAGPMVAGPGIASATVTGTHFHGHDALVSLRLADGTPIMARVLAPASAAAMTVGARVGVQVRGEVRVYPIV